MHMGKRNKKITVQQEIQSKHALIILKAQNSELKYYK